MRPAKWLMLVRICAQAVRPRGYSLSKSEQRRRRDLVFSLGHVIQNDYRRAGRPLSQDQIEQKVALLMAQAKTEYLLRMLAE